MPRGEKRCCKEGDDEEEKKHPHDERHELEKSAALGECGKRARGWWWLVGSSGVRTAICVEMAAR